MTSLAKAHRRITIAAIAVAATVLTALAGVGWWAAGKIDDRSIAHEQKAIRTGLGDLATVVALVADGVVGSVECIPLQAAQILRKQIA